ncbi:MAG: hypothetical protein HA489_01610 [Archaeoglobales archaeon]|nr:hypothetical protein [Archaeoglobales archaeon]
MRAAVALIFLLLPISVSAATVEPQIDFHVSAAIDELHAGDYTVLTLLVENGAKLSSFPVDQNSSQILAILTTAKDVRVELQDCYPISVENVNPQIIGDLPSGRVASVNFRVKVDENALAGEYSVPVEISFTKVSLSVIGSNYFISYTPDQKVTEYVKIKIDRKDYDFDAKVISGSLKAGREGKIDVIIENTGKNELDDAVAILNVSSPIIPNPDAISSYIGNLTPGEKISASFKVFVSDKALNQSYPASIILKFSAGSQQAAISKQIGLEIEKDSMLSILKVESYLTPLKTVQSQTTQSMPSSVSPLLSSLIQTQQSSQIVTINSRGAVFVEFESFENLQDAVAILSFENPLLQPENSPYIGKIDKGEKKTVIFYVKSLAPAGSYRGSFLLKYRNELGEEVVTPQESIEVNVKPSIINVEKVDSTLAVGLRGDLRVLLKNQIGYPVKSAEFYVIAPPSLTALSQSSYLDAIAPAEAREVKFRLSVSEDALGGYYKLYLVAKYKLGDAEDLISPIEVPVFVAPKTSAFEVLSIESELYPDSTGEVAVKLKNSGGAAARNAVVELQVLPPLTVAGVSSIASMIGQSQPGVYFVGTINPGEVVVAKFRIEVSKDAGAGFYPATITVSFDDEGGYKQKSNPITASIEVKERPILNAVTITALVLVLIALFAIVRFARKRRKA